MGRSRNNKHHQEITCQEFFFRSPVQYVRAQSKVYCLVTQCQPIQCAFLLHLFLCSYFSIQILVCGLNVRSDGSFAFFIFGFNIGALLDIITTCIHIQLNQRIKSHLYDDVNMAIILK